MSENVVTLMEKSEDKKKALEGAVADRKELRQRLGDEAG